MPKHNDENWYAEKRAMAYVYSLFAMNAEAHLTEVRDGNGSDHGVDLLIDLNGQKNFTMERKFAVAVKGCREFSSVVELSRQMSKDPINRFANESEIPVIVCVVQFVNLEAVYCWIVEPVVEGRKAGLRTPDECNWMRFQADAVQEILSKVDAFYEALYDVEIKKKRK
jgi:hypothetical protein